MDIYSIAGLNIGITNHQSFTKEYMKDYLVDDATDVDFTVTVTDQMIEKEKQIVNEDIPDQYFEVTAVLRAVCEVILEKYSGFFLHCSCLMYNEVAVIFTAQSGTGKSTHARLWRETFGDKVMMINDDKPIVRYIDGQFIIYGTPWDGKHRISNNTKAPIKAIFYLHQSKENKVTPCDPVSAITKLLSQTVLPDNKESMLNLLDMMEKLVSTTPMYDLYCDISKEAVMTAYNSIFEL